ncbi:MAG: TolB family protein, partial [Anaerolineales bacterium]
ISGREAPEADPFLAALTLSDGGLTPIAQSKRLRGGSISPGGGWVAYQVTFSGDPAQDGLWVARSDGSASRKLEFFGAYRWRAEGRLLVIPLETTGGSAGSRRFVEVEVSAGEMRAITDPALTPIHIAGGDWALSPDGARVAFVSADDHNIWVLELP